MTALIITRKLLNLNLRSNKYVVMKLHLNIKFLVMPTLELCLLLQNRYSHAKLLPLNGG